MEIVVELTNHGWQWKYVSTSGGEPEAYSRYFEALADCVNHAGELQTKGRWACLRILKPVEAKEPAENGQFAEIVK